MEKVCFKCNLLKPLTEYYKHSKTADRHLNKCKDCTKIDSKKTNDIKMSTPEGIAKERERAKDKYQRLNYNESQKIWDSDKPWKQTSTYKNLSRKFKTPKGNQIHHWNYNIDLLENFFIMTTKDHKNIHTYLILNLEKKLFMDLDGNLLDTKEKHLAYIKSKGFNIISEYPLLELN